MTVLDKLVNPAAAANVYLWERYTSAEGGDIKKPSLAFQYWPESLQDDYQVEYAEHMIPGGSHPLYQWVGGRGRTISFQAVFTSEINTSHTLLGPLSVAELTASNLYTVDVDGALNILRGWTRPQYAQNNNGDGFVSPPKKLVLAFPGTRLNGNSETISVILRSHPITYESWFPNGQPRVATVDLTFSEIVQSDSGGAQNQGASVRFIDRRAFTDDGALEYRFKGANQRPARG